MTDLVATISNSINITGMITYAGEILTAIISILDEVITVIAFMAFAVLVVKIIKSLAGGLSNVLDIRKMLKF